MIQKLASFIDIYAILEPRAPPWKRYRWQIVNSEYIATDPKEQLLRNGGKNGSIVDNAVGRDGKERKRKSERENDEDKTFHLLSEVFPVEFASAFNRSRITVLHFPTGSDSAACRAVPNIPSAY